MDKQDEQPTVSNPVEAVVSLREHSAPYLRKLSYSELIAIIGSEEYGECTKDRARYILI